MRRRDSGPRHCSSAAGRRVARFRLAFRARHDPEAGTVVRLARHGRAAQEGRDELTHWTQVLSNVSVVEFVLLAALTALQWARHRIRGAGWVALSFAVLGGVSLAVKIDPSTRSRTSTWPSALWRCCWWCPTASSASPRSFRSPETRRRRWRRRPDGRHGRLHLRAASPPLPGLPPLARTPRLPRLLRRWPFGLLFGYVVVRLPWPVGASRHRGLRGCGCWPWPSPGSRCRWWWPPSGLLGSDRPIWSRWALAVAIGTSCS